MGQRQLLGYDSTMRQFVPVSSCRRCGLMLDVGRLRHACASLLLVRGVELKVVQEILGHSQISLTADTYAHVMPSMKKDALDGLGELFG
jgi:integrase